MDFLLSQGTLTDEEIMSLVWEAVIEASDTTLVTTEWAMFELSRNPNKQVVKNNHAPFFFFLNILQNV